MQSLLQLIERYHVFVFWNINIIFPFSFAVRLVACKPHYRVVDTTRSGSVYRRDRGISCVGREGPVGGGRGVERVEADNHQGKAKRKKWQEVVDAKTSQADAEKKYIELGEGLIKKHLN